MAPAAAACRFACAAGALLAAALVAAFSATGAEPPVNPLRSSRPADSKPSRSTDFQPRATAVSARIDDEGIWARQPPEAATHSYLTAEAPVIEPKSVVPEHLGPPMPGYDDAYALPPEAYAPYPDAFPYAGWIPQRVHRWLREPWFAHSDPNDPYRHVGLGQPLIGTSWRNRPIYAGVFVGGVMMDDLTSAVDQSNTAFLGLRLGYDFDHFWAIEGRWAFARPELETSAGEPLDFSRAYFADVSLVHYPFGDAHWRPYLLAGIGFQTYRFGDETGQRIGESLFSIPLGFGVKYYCSHWFSLRFDFVDNIAFSSDRLDAMSNVALMAGCEFRFGGPRPSYFPWHNSTSYW